MIDATDRRILNILQRDSSYPVAKIAAQVRLSPTACWNRIQKLEEAGIIRERVTLLAPEKLGYQLVAFVTIEAGEHSVESQANFRRAIAEIPEVLEVYRMAGDIDYILRVLVRDVASYDRLYQKITGIVPLRKVISRFAIERIKSTTALPLSETTQLETV